MFFLACMFRMCFLICMRRKRIKRDHLAYYHCMSRIVGREMVIGEVEKEHMRRLIRRVEGFTGVSVLTYAVMTNHIHLLLEEPERDDVQSITNDELIRRLGCLYSEDEVGEICSRWKEWDAVGLLDETKEDKQRYLVRMNDISEFMKQVKQRFSCWYNRRVGRVGTLWEHRFKSVLVEDGAALRTMAAYIEMNPVRAGMVDDPKAYRFCGLGEAMGGVAQARRGIMTLVSGVGRLDDAVRAKEKVDAWGMASVTYWERVLMYDEVCKNPYFAMLDQDMIPDKLRRRMKISDSERLRCRSRYFCDGQVFGSQEFVEAFFTENRDYFGDSRQTGARKMRGGWGDLYTIRDLGHWCGD
ncbi:MAG: transposase [Spartobacteria bacterium]|nr:transposase [Spartobacteria bacterium]